MAQHFMVRRKLRVYLSAGYLVLFLPFSLSAQESEQEQAPPPGQSVEHTETPTTPTTQSGEEHVHQGMKAMPERMATMQQEQKEQKEMETELQQRLTALREHAQVMGKITDTQELVTAMKKHQQMTDALLGAMIEQHRRMHAMMRAHHERPREPGAHSSSGCCAMEQKELPAQ